MRVGFDIAVLCKCLVVGGIDGIGNYAREIPCVGENQLAESVGPIAGSLRPWSFRHVSNRVH
jgi:hypothetical protein